MPNDIVLITGGSGFLGQHLVKLIQEKEFDSVKEIRIVDLMPYSKKLDHSERIPVKSTIADICNINEIEEAFRDVDTVFHCAAFISLAYPIEKDKLERVNIDGKLET